MKQKYDIFTYEHFSLLTSCEYLSSCSARLTTYIQLPRLLRAAFGVMYCASVGQRTTVSVFTCLFVRSVFRFTYCKSGFSWNVRGAILLLRTYLNRNIARDKIINPRKIQCLKMSHPLLVHHVWSCLNDFKDGAWEYIGYSECCGRYFAEDSTSKNGFLSGLGGTAYLYLS